MRTSSSFPRPVSTSRDSRYERISALVGLAAGISFLLGIGAALDLVELTTAIQAGSGLAAVGGITAFLGDA